MSYTASCVPIIMYDSGLFLLFADSNPNVNTCSLFALWISTFLQNFITLCCLVFELRDLEEEEKKKIDKTLYHSSMHL